MFGAWNRDPGQWEAVLSKNRSADLFHRFFGTSSPIWGGRGVARETNMQISVHRKGRRLRCRRAQDVWQELGPEEMSDCDEDPEVVWDSGGGGGGSDSHSSDS